jgi:hypothetical protein
MVKVPDMEIVPIAIPLFPLLKLILLNVCPLVIKNVEDRLDDDTVPSVGVPISLLLPRTRPLKESLANGGELKVICEDEML